MYREVEEDIWSFKSDVKVITTNCIVKRNGAAVMGKGLALQASRRFPKLSLQYGNYLRNCNDGSIKPIHYSDYNLIMFPSKYNWRDKADYDLIIKSMKGLHDICISNNIKRVVMPRVGCGDGKLDWNVVKKKISDMLDVEDIEFIIAKI